ncbi:MAG: methyl-accepting chemotaxis protein [Rikenellaceae bacterium]
MKTKFRLKTRGKLIVCFLVIIVATIIMAFISNSNIRQMNNTQFKITTLDGIINDLTGLRADENRLIALAYELMISQSDSHKEKIKKEITLKEESLFRQIDQIDSMLVDYPEQKVLVTNLFELFQTYHKNGERFFSMIDNGKVEEIYTLMLETQGPLYETLSSTSMKIEKEISAIRKVVFLDNSVLIKQVKFELTLLGIVLILLTSALAYIVLYMIKKITEELVSGVSVLANSSAEILGTVNEISTSATETATAVSETTTTIEEVRQTAMIANQRAQSLIESSQKAADSADKGKESVVNVIDAIMKIDHQMNIISETVVKLSEQNKTIGEITSTVSDIADQSNLLAVNAAIEAAKAGEHGRGFTVIAQEIRSLADQSKKATKQVKEILEDINKSVSQAVGVTDQGAKTVENGLKLVRQSGDVIDLLSENVEETAQASMQISSSNQQQMAGMDQIVPAMENIKIASKQNVKGIQQAQSASQDIHNLGQALKKVIIKYDL